MRRFPSDKRIEEWTKSIKENGYKNVKLRALLKAFGFERRGSAAVKSVNDWLLDRDKPIHTFGLETKYRNTLDDSVMLAHHEMTQIGPPVQREDELYACFKEDIMPRLRLTSPRPQYSPKGTRDRFDFLCNDKQGRSVVVEMKKNDGEKHGVEQVMRYIGQLRSEGGHQDPWGILITNWADPWTRHALLGREKDEHISWYVYGLQDTGSVALQEVPVRR